jgi:hypothetical protein
VTLYDCWNAYLFKIVVSDVIEWAESASWLLFERLWMTQGLFAPSSNNQNKTSLPSHSFLELYNLSLEFKSRNLWLMLQNSYGVIHMPLSAQLQSKSWENTHIMA